jgi:hypothetical protein
MQYHYIPDALYPGAIMDASVFLNGIVIKKLQSAMKINSSQIIALEPLCMLQQVKTGWKVSRILLVLVSLKSASECFAH